MAKVKPVKPSAATKGAAEKDAPQAKRQTRRIALNENAASRETRRIAMNENADTRTTRRIATNCSATTRTTD